MSKTMVSTSSILLDMIEYRIFPDVGKSAPCIISQTFIVYIFLPIEIINYIIFIGQCPKINF